MRMSLLHGGSFAGRLAPRFSHRSYSTTSEGAAALNFNSYWDIPIDSRVYGNAHLARRLTGTGGNRIVGQEGEIRAERRIRDRGGAIGHNRRCRGGGDGSQNGPSVNLREASNATRAPTAMGRGRQLRTSPCRPPSSRPRRARRASSSRDPGAPRSATPCRMPCPPVSSTGSGTSWPRE